MAASRRIPGIVFRAEPRAAGRGLPRLDVAAFVGFTASGPLDVPILVEDIGRFHDIFAEDLPLAWDTQLGEMTAAHLAPSVRTFFRNGGKRCWVVRVAGDAVTNRFAAPGVLRAEDTGAHTAAVFEARSGGSWSDGVLINMTVLPEPVGIAGLTAAGSGRYVVRLEEQALATGDLLRLDYRASGCVQFLPVSSVDGGAGQVERAYWFQALQPADLSATAVASAVQLRAGGDAVLTGASWWSVGGEMAVTARRRDTAGLQEGSLLRLRTTTGTTVFLEVSEVRSLPPSGGEEQVRLVGGRAWRTLADSDGQALTSGAQFGASRVALTAWARLADGRQLTIEGLGLAPGHPRLAGALPSDEKLFTPPDRPSKNPYEALWQEASQPRFPLAGVETGVCLPLAALPAPREEFYRPPDPPAESAFFGGQPATPLERDGLASFSEGLFLDQDLANKSIYELLGAAFAKQFGLRGGMESRRQLEKMHALLPVEEVSLISVPDCLHAGWEPHEQESVALAAPALSGSDQAGGTYRLSWSAITGAAQYQIEESDDPRFSTVRRIDAGTGLQWVLEKGTCCPQWIYYRVRARVGNRWGPWSGSVWRRSPLEPFTDTADVPPTAPVLGASLSTTGRLDLAWTGQAGQSFTLEAASEPDFLTPRRLYDGTKKDFSLVPPANISYFRAGASQDGRPSPWSNTVVAGESTTGRWRTKTRPEPDKEVTLRAVHAAMLRFAAARGDTVAILSLPAEFRQEEALAYQAALGGAVEEDEGRTFSFGALYHPWLNVRDFVHERLPRLRVVPPDGVVLGTLADRSLSRGPWVAAANQSIRDVVALEPALGADAAIALYERQINLIRQNVRGFLALCEDTLSAESSLRPLHVRRLLILLRRLALREGMLFVFQPNDESFRRMVRRHFEGVLLELFSRGAFAGDSPEEAFRVVTDASVNPPASVEAGRFVVELRVAPSQALEFLTVRLFETGTGVLTTEEA